MPFPGWTAAGVMRENCASAGKMVACSSDLHVILLLCEKLPRAYFVLIICTQIPLFKHLVINKGRRFYNDALVKSKVAAAAV